MGHAGALCGSQLLLARDVSASGGGGGGVAGETGDGGGGDAGGGDADGGGDSSALETPSVGLGAACGHMLPAMAAAVPAAAGASACAAHHSSMYMHAQHDWHDGMAALQQAVGQGLRRPRDTDGAAGDGDGSDVGDGA